MRVLLLLAAAFLCGLAGCRGDETDEYLRPAAVLPTPTETERLRLFFDLMVSGESIELGGRAIHVWRSFGEATLVKMGRPALDFLLSENRTASYEKSHNILATVLRILPAIEGFGAHERLQPFLLHWLEHGGDHVRRPIFTVFVAAPDPAAVPACVDELRRSDRDLGDHDLGDQALYVLLETGRGGIINDLYASLPPTRRVYLLAHLHRMAGAGEADRVRELRPVLDAALESKGFTERISALAILRRLGEGKRAGQLIEEFRRADREGRQPDAWTALHPLVNDRLDPRVREIALKRVREGTDAPGYRFAIELLWRGFLDDAAVRKLVWEYVQWSPSFDARPLLRLVHEERARVVEYLRAQIRGSDSVRRNEAIRFAQKRGLPELTGDLLDLILKTPDDPGRALYYHVLTVLRAPRVVPLLVREYKKAKDASLRAAAAASLLEFGDADALAPLASALRKGEPTIVREPLARTRRLGKDGVDARFVAPLLDALRGLPAKDDRLRVLMIFRFRGTLADAREGLIEAYRTEQSRRVAGEIRRTLLELAHR